MFSIISENIMWRIYLSSLLLALYTKVAMYTSHCTVYIHCTITSPWCKYTFSVHTILHIDEIKYICRSIYVLFTIVQTMYKLGLLYWGEDSRFLSDDQHADRASAKGENLKTYNGLKHQPKHWVSWYLPSLYTG